jgi:hypothetical protein
LDFLFSVTLGSDASSTLPITYHGNLVWVCSQTSLHEREVGKECPSLHWSQF